MGISLPLHLPGDRLIFILRLLLSDNLFQTKTAVGEGIPQGMQRHSIDQQAPAVLRNRAAFFPTILVDLFPSLASHLVPVPESFFNSLQGTFHCWI